MKTSNRFRWSAIGLGLLGFLPLATTGCDYSPPPNPQPSAPPVASNAPTQPPPSAADNTPDPSPPSPTEKAPPSDPTPPSATPPATSPAVPSTPPVAANPLAASTSYLANTKAVEELLVTVVDGDTAKAAAEPLRKLAEQQRPLIRPFWLWLTTLSSDEKVKFANERAVAAMAFEKQHGPNSAGLGKLQSLITIAKEPGNEAFKAALAALLQANVDESPRIHAANYQKLLDRLNQ